MVAAREYRETSITCLPRVDYLEHVAVVARVVLDGGQVRVVGPGPVHTEAVLVPPLQYIVQCVSKIDISRYLNYEYFYPYLCFYVTVVLYIL